MPNYTDLRSVFRIETDQNKKGTGFLVFDNKHILTAYHTINLAQEIRIKTGIPNQDGSVDIKADLIEISGLKSQDIALLVLHEALPSSYEPLQLEVLNNENTDIRMLGFPVENSQVYTFNGIVNARIPDSDSSKNRYEILFNGLQTFQLKGLSGGPAIDIDKGTIVGLVTKHNIDVPDHGEISGFDNQTINTLQIYIDDEFMLPETIDCYVVTSETEGNRPIQNHIRNALIAVEGSNRKPEGLKINTEPIIKNVTEIFSSPNEYLSAIKAICQLEIAVFDVTNFEPAVMLLLGIRSVVKRGITICSIGGNYVIGDVMDFPFNIKEVSYSSHSRKQADKGGRFAPKEQLSNRILSGLRQYQENYYSDLPVYNAIRNLLPNERRSKSLSEQILFLCSYSDDYQFNKWSDHRDSLTSQFEGTNIMRILDKMSPRLVSKTIYEEIRLCTASIIDWTEWSANVFFELGVRLAITTNQHKTINIIDETHLDPLQVQSDAKSNRGNARLETIQQQCQLLLDLFQPDAYQLNNIAHFYSDLRYSIEDNPNNIAFTGKSVIPSDFTYNAINRFLEAETTYNPIYKNLLNDALFLIPDSSEGFSPNLFTKDTNAQRVSQILALEYLVAAWKLLEYKFNNNIEMIKQNKQLLEDYIGIGRKLFLLLSSSDQPEDQDFAFDVFKFVDELETIEDDPNEDVIDRAQRLKEKSQARREFALKTNKDRLEDAIPPLEQAIIILEDALDSVGSKQPIENDDKALIHQYAADIADCYGMMAGIYRRMDDRETALEFYRNGFEYEEQYDLDSTYNATNVVINGIFQDSFDIDAQGQQIKKLINKIYLQIKDDRHGNWWAWADLGQFRLLDRDWVGASEAYKRFMDSGASVNSYDSVIGVLQNLGDKLSENHPDISEEIDKVIVALRNRQEKLRK